MTAETWSQADARGGVAMFLGGATGLAGMYLALVMVLLVSRVPAVEHVLGQDGLLRWHRRLAPWPISLIVAHVVLLTVAYAQAARRGVWHEMGTIVPTFPYMIEATAGFLLMVAVAWCPSGPSVAGCAGSAGGHSTCSCTWPSLLVSRT